MPKRTAHNHNLYLGVDPGQSGGLVSIRSESDAFSVEPMPPTERDVWDWFQSQMGGCDRSVSRRCVAVIEKVHAMPKQGVSSSFKFGVGYGGLRMGLIAAGIPFEEVTPQAWQKALIIPKRKKTETKTKFKNRLKAMAQQLFPSENVTLKTADALLIATYCYRKQRGLL